MISTTIGALMLVLSLVGMSGRHQKNAPSNEGSEISNLHVHGDVGCFRGRSPRD
jgi:hypothetical protein